MSKSTPYESATTGIKARDEITKILRTFGCSNVGFMDNFDEKSLILAFTHKGRKVHLEASAKGWAVMFLKNNPWTTKKRTTKIEWEHRATNQGLIAINSILRDWVKGQVTAIETGVLSFEAVFMPHMLTNEGVPLVQHIMNKKLLPEPKREDKL